MEGTARQNYGGNSVWLLRHGDQNASEPTGGNAKHILNNSSGSGPSVVKHALSVSHISQGQWFHVPGLQCKCICIITKPKSTALAYHLQAEVQVGVVLLDLAPNTP